MKNLLKLLIVVVALTMTSRSAVAQLKFGVKGGFNVANMVETDNDETYSYDSKVGFHLGVTAEYPISKKIAIEPGLLFSTKGYEYELLDVKVSSDLNYLEIPVNAIYKIDLRKAKILINAGPYLGYALSGKMKASEAIFGEDEDSKEQKIEIGSDKVTDDIKPLDFGLNIGAGVEFKNITIGFQSGIGLSNLSPDTDNGQSIKNSVSSISVGYKFGKK